MRILNSMIDPRIGGPQLRALAVAQRLREQDVETEFLLPDGDDEFSQRARSHGFEVHRPGLSRIYPPRKLLKNIRYALRYPLSVKRISEVIADQSVDVVHANMPLNFDAAVGTKLSSVALVWHFNDIQTPWPLNRFAAHIATNMADELVVAAECVGNHYFPQSRTDPFTLYAPVDVQKFDPDRVSGHGLRDELNVDESCVVVGSVGNINPIKGHKYLIQAAGRIVEEIDESVVFPIIGSVLESRSTYYQELHQLRTELNVDEEVQFLGRRLKIPELLSQFDVFVLPSIAEACPMSVLEAMAMEKPVVATRVGGIPEQITDGKSGWLVPSKNPAALANAIVAAIEHEKEAQRRGIFARKKVIEQFSLEECVDRHLHVYRRAVKG